MKQAVEFLENDVKEKRKASTDNKNASSPKQLPAQSLIPAELYHATGKDLSRSLLIHPRPRDVVRNISRQDYFQLVKRAGEESLSLLALGSEEQWQFLLDLDVWDRDRIDVDRLALWMERFGDADPERFSAWLFREELHLTLLFFHACLEVTVLSPDDEDVEIPADSFTFDGIIYLRFLRETHFEALKPILDTMARFDMQHFSSLLLSLAGMIPAEMEEDLYRLRNARLADEGFLPFEEAHAIYAPLNHEDLSIGGNRCVVDSGDTGENDVTGVAPRLPLSLVGGPTLLQEVLQTFPDSPELDRIRREFAGLCNQVLSADGISIREPAALTAAVEKAAGYLNMALERLSDGDLQEAENAIRSHALLSLFRVGYGLIAEVVRETERWVRESWFRRAGLPFAFWGESGEMMLKALLARRPRFYDESGEEGILREFRSADDPAACRITLAGLVVLDELFSGLDRACPIDGGSIGDKTFHPLLITFFAGRVVGGQAGYTDLPLYKAREFLDRLRGGDARAPSALSRHREAFIDELLSFAPPGINRRRENTLRKLLASLWHDFEEEYGEIASADLSPRYSRLLLLGQE